MVNGQHKKPSRWRRKILGVPVVGWLIGLTGTALAIIGLIVTLGTSGSITVQEDKIDVTYRTTQAPLAEPSVGSPVCSASYLSTTELQITLDEVAAGDVCHFAVQVANAGPATARLNGFRLASAGFAGGEITAAVDACGVSIAPGVFSDAGFTITIGAVSSGQTFTFDPTVDGLEWRASPHYVAAECNGA